MRRVLIAFLLLSTTTLSGAQKELLQRLSDEHRKWVEEDVRYIITDREQELYVSLETLDERDRFIAAFWRRRDPNRTTPDNEFKEEHYARLEYANEFLGRESFIPGWRTDRGRYYIILGKPRQIQRFYGYAHLKEAELWFYQGEDGRGTPAFFYLLFFKREEVGDYRLYHPMIDGPASLLRGTEVTAGMENLAAVERLEETNVELAHASLSFDTGEPPDYFTGRPAIGIDAMIARLDESAKRGINTDYIDAFNEYGRRVSADYSFNFVPNRNVFSVMVGPEATPIVHFSVELDPTNFGLEADETGSRFYTTLDVTVEVTDSEGKLTHSNMRSDFIELTPAQVERIQTAPVAYQDDFPLVPGDYTIAIYLQNRALKNYTVAEAQIHVPAFSQASPALADILLCHEATMAAQAIAPDEVRTFQLGGLRLEPATDRLFAIGDTIIAFSHAYGALPGSKVSFELVAARQDGAHDNTERVITEASGGGVTAKLSTLGLVGGSYEIRARLNGPDGANLSERKVEITLSPRTSVPRPGFVYRRGFNTKIPGLLPLVRGDQLWNLGRYEEAQENYESAVAAANPNLPHARWKLATALLRENDADRAISLLAPLEESFAVQFEVMAGLGLGFYIKEEYVKAVGYLERASAIHPPDTSLLNALADSHQRLGDIEKARGYFERSLALDPAQDAVKKRLAGLESQG